MKIAMIINTSWTIFNFRLGLIKELQKHENTIYALAPRDSYSKLLEDNDVNFFHIPINPKSVNPIHDINLFMNYYKELKRLRPDVVLSYTVKSNIYASFACRLLKISIICNVSGLGTAFMKNFFLEKITKLLYRSAFKKSFWIFFQNETDKLQFETMKLISPCKSSVLPGSGVNLNKFNCNRRNNEGFNFLFVGRLLSDKGIRELIHAFNKLSKENQNVQLLLVGELGYNNPTSISKAELTTWLQNQRIEYIGKRDYMVEIYQNADIMVLPSYREGLSKSLIEAAAMNLPIITTNVPGCREVVTHGQNGYLCNPKDPEDLYLKMLDMINLSDDERIQMGENSRIIAEKTFDERIVISKYLEKISILVKV